MLTTATFLADAHIILITDVERDVIAMQRLLRRIKQSVFFSSHVFNGMNGLDVLSLVETQAQSVAPAAIIIDYNLKNRKRMLAGLLNIKEKLAAEVVVYNVPDDESYELERAGADAVVCGGILDCADMQIN